jgi:hypothetical protein
MVRRRLDMLAAAAALSLTAAAPAAAGGCCPAPYSNCPCAPLAVAEPFVAPSGIYVVNLGPVYSGPGPYLPREPSVNPLALSGGYPYVGSVYTGYPYAEPLGYPVVKRVSYRPARVYHRGPRVMRMPGK